MGDGQTEKEALEALSEGSFTLLVLDLHLPEVDGLGVLHSLRSDPAAQCPRIAVLIADVHLAGTCDLRALGADDVLTKPLDLTAFVKMLADSAAA